MAKRSVQLCDVRKQEDESAKLTAKTLNIDECAAFLLLQAEGWNRESVCSKYHTNPSAMTAKIGLTPDQVKSPSGLRPPATEVTGDCPICSQPAATLALSCGHSACPSCWKDHVKARQSDAIICCVVYGCKCRLVAADIQLLSGPNAAAEFRTIIANNHVGRNDQFRYCPKSGCNRIIPVEAVRSCNAAQCECGTSFCWKCGSNSHAPLPCTHVQKWREYCQSLPQRQDAMLLTQPCPFCSVTIEKNGGCNHMTCTNCKVGFCWICRQNLGAHSDQTCSAEDARQKTLNLAALRPVAYDLYGERHRDRFVQDEQAFSAERQADSSAQEKIAKILLPTRDAPVQARAIVEAGFRTLELSRYVLTWTQARLFYLKWEPGASHTPAAVETALEVTRQAKARFTSLINAPSGLSCATFQNAAQALDTAINALVRASSQ